MVEESHEEQVKKVRNVIRVLASQWFLTKHLDIKVRKVVLEFADWLDAIMSEEEGD